MHVRNGLHDQRIKPTAQVALPARHGRNIGLHRTIAFAFGNLRVAARQQDGFGRLRAGTLRGLDGPRGRVFGHGMAPVADKRRK
ncbi:hypothetical protein G6F31_021882 [Rhizopus arrhizus]|nr:hypothetical protein G6F31_021882 [Rhizopus arrhizus]